MMELETIKLGTNEIEQAISNQREAQATEKLDAVSRSAELQPESDAIELEQEVTPEQEEVPEIELETLVPEESEVLLEDPVEEPDDAPIESAATQVLGSAPPCLSFALVLEGAKAKLQVGRGLVFMVVLKFVPMGFPYASFPPAEPTGVAG